MEKIDFTKELNLHELVFRPKNYMRHRYYYNELEWKTKILSFEHRHYLDLLYHECEERGYNYDSYLTQMDYRIEGEYQKMKESLNLFYRVHFPPMVYKPKTIKRIDKKDRAKFF